MRLGFLGFIPFTAPYLPWVMLLFSFIIGNPLETDLLGIIIGHMYYFLNTVYPQVASIRGWRVRKIIVTPSILHYICGTRRLQVDGVEPAPVVVHD